MYSMTRNTTIRSLLVEQAPSFLVAFTVAELFYKFHSFTLECLAFLATWYVFDAAYYHLRGFLQHRSQVTR